MGDDFGCVRGSSITVKVINLGYNKQTRYSVGRRSDRGFTLDSGVALVDSWGAADPEVVKTAPHTAPVRRLDEAGAARNPNLRWRAAAGDWTPCPD